MTAHSGLAPSHWIQTWSEIILPGGRVLDLACGSGRHARWLAQRGFSVQAVDRDASLLAAMEGEASIRTLAYDLEADPWPYAREKFDAVVVTNYLHRPLFSALLACLTERGVLLYETFALGNERFGRPANPDFLLRPGELLSVVHGELHVVAYEDRYVAAPKPAMVQRICAVAVRDSSAVWR